MRDKSSHLLDRTNPVLLSRVFASYPPQSKEKKSRSGYGEGPNINSNACAPVACIKMCLLQFDRGVDVSGICFSKVPYNCYSVEFQQGLV